MEKNRCDNRQNMGPLTFSLFSSNSEFSSLSFCFSLKINMLRLKTVGLGHRIYDFPDRSIDSLSRLTSSERARRSQPSPAGPSAHPALAPRLVSAPPAV